MWQSRSSRWTRGAIGLAVAGLAAFSVVSCSNDDSGSSSSGKTVKIAFMGDLTGENKALGINIRDGAKLAIDQYNATNPGTKITLKEYDTQGDPTQAASIVNKVISDGNAGVVGPAFSGESKTAVPGLNEAGIPNISASATNVDLSKNGWKTWHRVLANDGVQGPGIADFMAKQLDVKKAAVIDDQSEYGKGLADAVAAELKAKGASVVVRDAIDPKADDYSSTVTKVKNGDVDATFYGGYYAQAGTLVKQLRDGGVKGKFVSGDGTLDQKFVDNGGSATEGAYLGCTCVLATASDDPKVQKFIDDYQAAFKQPPGTYSSEGYDAATAFIAAVKAGKTSAADILGTLADYDVQGISKQIKWEANGELTGGTTYLHLVKGGKIVALGDYKTAKAS